MEYKETMGKRISDLRKGKGMTQEALAEKLFVTRQTVSNYETGKSQPDVDTIIRLAETLQVDPNTLIYGIPTPPDRKREYIRMAIIAAMAASSAETAPSADAMSRAVSASLP